MKERKSGRGVFLAALSAAMLMAETLPSIDDAPAFSAPCRESHPWDRVQLSKADRLGKSRDEIQAMRKKRYESAKESLDA